MESIPATSGIYKITCSATNKYYIGSAVNLYQRKHQHFSDLRLGKHGNSYLQHAFNKHGDQAFTFVVLELVLTPFLLEREQYWIDHLRAADRSKGYNLAPTAGSQLGIKHSDATRAKLRIIGRARTATPEARARMREIGSRSWGTAEGRAKMSASQRLIHARPEWKAKQSATRRRLWSSPAYRAATIAAQNEGRATPEYKAKRRGIARRLWSDPAFRAKWQEAVLQPDVRAKRQTPQAKAQRARALAAARATPKRVANLRAAQQRPAYREKKRQAMIARMADPQARADLSATLKATFATPAAKAKKGAATKAGWANEETRAKRIAGIRAGRSNPAVAAVAKEIRTLYATGDYTQAALAKQFNLSETVIRGIIHNKTYTSLGESEGSK